MSGIGFSTIPSNARVPKTYLEVSNERANKGLITTNKVALLIGQRLSSGSVLTEVLTNVYSKEQGIGFFGEGSSLALMVEAYYANNPGSTELKCIALDDAATGVPATGTVTFTGTATEAGSIVIYIDGKPISVAVASGDVFGVVATALNTAINAEYGLPVTSGVAAGVVTLTTRGDGEYGNEVTIIQNFGGAANNEKDVAGITTAIVAMASGANNPDISDAIAVMPDENFDYIGHHFLDSANLTLMDTEMNRRWGSTVELYGHSFISKGGTTSTVGTFGNTRNNQHLSIMDAGLTSPTPAFQWTGALVGATALYASADPARQLRTVPLTGVIASAEANRRTFTEKNVLVWDGIALHSAQADGSIAIDRLLTSYQTNAVGAPDPSYLDANTLFTIQAIAQTTINMINTTYPRHKLAPDGTRFGSGQSVATPSGIKASLVALAREWENVAWIKNVDSFKELLVVEINGSDPNRVDILLPPDIIGNFRIGAISLQFGL